MITVRFDGVEVEIDPISIAVSASQQFRIFRRRGIFRYLRGEIYLVSSNLFALGQGTEVQVGDTRLAAAPLLKPYPDGSATLVNSGFLVTGIYDSFGQTELGSALARASRSFVITSDSDPEIDREANLVCFGSPSSNIVSNDIYESLNSVTNQCFQWTSGYNCFTLLDSEYCGGDQGIVLFHDSPWNRNRKVLVLSGIGPMGTLGCCKAVASWDETALSRKQRISGSFICAIEFNPTLDEFASPVVLGFEEL